jgi:uncharacterized protein YndB with AHSA1/START domain
MNDMNATVEMLIRKPAGDVFEAFVNPRSLEKFWLKSASGPLAKDATVEWEFMVEGARETVTVTEFIPNQTIAFRWSDGIAVTMRFAPHDISSTRLSITATGFKGPDASSAAVNATEGFTIVVCDLKSLLETGQSGNMVRDKAVLISSAKTLRRQSCAGHSIPLVSFTSGCPIGQNEPHASSQNGNFRAFSGRNPCRCTV